MDLTKIKELLEGNEKAKEILAEINKQNGLDVEKVKNEKAELETKIKNLEESSKNADEFKTKYEELKKEVDTRKAEEEKARIESELKGRFDKVVGEKKFRDELTQNAIFENFKKALNDESNKGKGDSDILEELTKDTNYWENPNQQGSMKGASSTQEDVSLAEENKIREIMGLPINKG